MRAMSVLAMVAMWIGGAAVCIAQDRLSMSQLVTPAQPVGRKTDHGTAVSSLPDGFEIELTGQQFRPLSQDRLLWDVDGVLVELQVLRKPAGASWSAQNVVRELEAATSARDVESVSVQSGEAARWIWSTADGTLGVASIPAGLLVIKVAGKASPGSAAARSYVKAMLLTLREPNVTRRAEAAPPSPEAGASLQGQLRLNSALFGEQYYAMLNSRLATATDKQLPTVIPLDPESLADFARWLLGLGEEFGVNVFDGRVAHAINLQAYDFATETFVYWDPWGKGSFLERGNNAAGVSARPHPTAPRQWLISFSELESVLYAILGSEHVLFDGLRLCTLSTASPQLAYDTYLELAKDKGAKSGKSNTVWLEGAARELYRVNRPNVAAALLAVRVTIDPKPLDRELVTMARSGGVDDMTAFVDTMQRGNRGAPPRRAQPQTAEAAQATEFFEFFHLQQAQADPRSVTFRPRATQFAQRVKVVLHLGSDGIVTSRELAVRQSFIDDPAASRFAADITKSFIDFAVDSGDHQMVRPLLDEIYGGGSRRVAIPGALNSATQVPAMPSTGALTYRGARPAFSMTLPATQLNMRHEGNGEDAELIVTVSAR